ncbi:MAG TPA: energy-coupling factor transporter transmembrane protein EcfT [Thermoprotei archaeon]|nr:energy-coupling factor transporter transmembrane protein EcfT [Thermoprotei archaeon]
MSLKVFEGLKFKKRNTVIHKLDARTKGVYVISIMIIAVTISEIIPLIILFLLCLLTAFIAKVLNEWIRTMKGVLFFALLIFFLNFVTISENRVNQSFIMFLRFIVLSAGFSIFFLTTSPDDFSQALLKIGIPYEYTLMLTIALRFIPTLARDVQTIIDAQRSRGLELERGNIMNRIRNYIPILVPLIIYEIRRSIMIAEALESRAFGAEKKRTNLYEIKLSKIDYLVIIMAIALTTLLIYLNFLHLLPSIFYLRLPEFY